MRGSADVGLVDRPVHASTTHAILGPLPDLRFHCPLLDREVAWAAKDVFNPAAVVHDGRLHLLFRAEDHDGPYAGTSRLGLAISDDGIHFDVASEPVLHPADDDFRSLEWPGGCEDPRVVVAPDGGFVCLYTAFEGTTAVLCVATSPDLRAWTKHGPAFRGTPHEGRWSKSGAVVTAFEGDQLVATRLDGRFWMYWGEGIVRSRPIPRRRAHTGAEARSHRRRLRPARPSPLRLAAVERTALDDGSPLPATAPGRVPRPPHPRRVDRWGRIAADPSRSGHGSRAVDLAQALARGLYAQGRRSSAATPRSVPAD